jgi:hypothetical protein
MRKLCLVIAAVVLALAPLAWASTIAPPAQPIHTHDQSGKAITLASSSLAVPVAEAHSGSTVANTDSRARHIQHLVRLQIAAGILHAECWAKNDGGSHDHSHRITACQLQTNRGVILRGICPDANSYGPCGWSTQNQHWHSPTRGNLLDCYRAVGGFDTTGHSHATIAAPSSGWWCFG